jgi:flagellar assembly factor FliW
MKPNKKTAAAMGRLAVSASTVSAEAHDAAFVRTPRISRKEHDMMTTQTMVEITTPEGLPGFTDARSWTLETDEDAVFLMLRSNDLPGVALVLADPWPLAPGYEPDLPDADLADIGVTKASDMALYVVVGIDASRRLAWLNLAAPLALNAQTAVARQVILDRQGWPVRHPVALDG